MFVTGGDDGKVKVFNYQQRRCLFTLTGHMDYIRTVFFHHQSPWIVSASDDQTVRVWNWQSRSCLAVLTGHSHYVMCAQFHPGDDLLVSASLDQTIRVWDIGSLRRKHSSPASSPYEVPSPRAGIDLFGAPEGQVKFVLEGHDRGVNWVQFHPTKPLIVSGSDDRSVKLWRYNDSRAWETDTFRGHFNNISCVMFHPHADLILSNSEDKTIRIWDYTKRGAQPTVYRRDTERFWILASHPKLNLIAAGHDAGMMIFKLEHERPAYTIHDEMVISLKNNHLIAADAQLKETAITMVTEKMFLPATVSFSAADNALLLSGTNRASTYLLCGMRGSGENVRKGDGAFATFVARNRFAVLNFSTSDGDESKSATVAIKALDNTTFRVVPCPKGVNRLLPSTSGSFLLASTEKIYSYSLQNESISLEANIPNVKYIAWSPDMQRLALYGRHVIYIVDRQTFNVQSTIRDTVNIKSCVWDTRGVLYYTNSNHLKYVLPNGDVGVLCTIEEPLYLLRVREGAVTVIDRSATVRVTKIDPTEIVFKLALLEGDQSKVLEMIETSNLIGQSIIAYLRKNGYAEIALGFVSEPATRFKLALECCDLDAALDCAKKLEHSGIWKELAEAAMSLGNFMIAEQCFSYTGDRDRLGFLYLITGNISKLQAMTDEARALGDINTRLKNSLLLGDNVDLASSLADVGASSLAYLACRSAGLDVEAQDILERQGPSASASRTSVESSLLPTGRLSRLEPLIKQTNAWPLVADPIKTRVSVRTKASLSLVRDIESCSGSAHQPIESSIQIPPDFDESGGWGIEEADTMMELGTIPSPTEEQDFVDIEDGTLPLAGPDALEPLRNGESSPYYLFSLGDIKGGLRVLREQFEISRFEPLEPLIMRCLQGSGVPFGEFKGTVKFIPNLSDKEGHRALHPKPIFTIESLKEELEAALQLTTSGKFHDASKLLENVLHASLFVLHEDNEVEAQMERIIGICREYLVGLHVEQLRKDSLSSDPEMSMALACYFTYCKLRTDHMVLALRSALTQAYKMQCFSLAGRLARRLIGCGPSESVVSQAQKIVTLAEKLPLNHQDPVTIIDQSEVKALDSASGLPIDGGVIKCSFCQAPYAETVFGDACSICKIGTISHKF